VAVETLPTAIAAAPLPRLSAVLPIPQATSTLWVAVVGLLPEVAAQLKPAPAAAAGRPVPAEMPAITARLTPASRAIRRADALAAPLRSWVRSAGLPSLRDRPTGSWADETLSHEAMLIRVDFVDIGGLPIAIERRDALTQSERIAI
jgi:hypothetical protein